MKKRNYRTSRQTFRKRDNQKLRQSISDNYQHVTHWGRPHYRQNSQPQQRKSFDKMNGYPTIAEAFERVKNGENDE